MIYITVCHLQLYERNKEIRAKLENNREKEIERERQMAQGVKAREATVLSKKPFLPIGRHVQMFRLLLKTIFDRKQHAQGLTVIFP